ncbi:MAG: N(4)-(beta-N-acetylglucosaminyl)-L-asparaginase [Holophagaceae bacterium]
MSAVRNRRDFLLASLAAGAAASLDASGPKGLAPGQAPAIRKGGPRPVVIASANGHRFKNGGRQTCVETAFDFLTKGGDPLEAVISGVNVVELDPLDDSVGYGGLPNAEGVVQLDACCMHGPRKAAGGVACLEGVRTPSRVAQAVMEETDHHLLVGRDAQAFAKGLGFTVEADLNTEHSRRKWMEWRRRLDPEHWLDPAKRARAAAEARASMVRDGLLDPEHVFGTINCTAVTAKGEVAGVTTTSGLAWKIPGRVGDSPILGAGLYVDNTVGAAGSTGRGEANLYGLSSFLIVELMRKGMKPRDAGMEALRRVQASTVEKRLLNGRGLPNFGLSFYVLGADGSHAGVSMYASTYAVCDEAGPRILPTEPLLPGKEED